MNDIVRSLEFAPAVSMLADKIIHDMFVKSHWPFNGVHLRLERDGISAWASGAGQSEVRLHIRAHGCLKVTLGLFIFDLQGIEGAVLFMTAQGMFLSRCFCRPVGLMMGTRHCVETGKLPTLHKMLGVQHRPSSAPLVDHAAMRGIGNKCPVHTPNRWQCSLCLFSMVTLHRHASVRLIQLLLHVGALGELPDWNGTGRLQQKSGPLYSCWAGVRIKG